jgi:hypothetical protein
VNLRRILERLRPQRDADDPDDLGAADQRSVSNTDGMAAAGEHYLYGQAPPNYVKDYDEGRPKK